MEKLRAYLNSLSGPEQEQFAALAKTSVGYLRKALSINQQLSEGLAMRIEVASRGAVRGEDICPEAPWSAIRSAPPELATQAKEAANA